MATSSPSDLRHILDAMGLEYTDPIRQAAEDFANRSTDEKLIYLLVNIYRLTSQTKTRTWLDLSARGMAGVGLVVMGGVLQQYDGWKHVVASILNSGGN